MDSSICQVESQGEVTVLSMNLDDVDVHQERVLMRDFFKLVDEGSKNIVIDLSRTSHIASVGIAVLIFMLKRTKKKDCNLAICGASEKIKNVLKTTNVDTLFEVYDDREKAISRLTSA
ncbi:MAG: STAS domain-containing protein [Candidatus Omnitrophota bacterium]